MVKRERSLLVDLALSYIATRCDKYQNLICWPIYNTDSERCFNGRVPWLYQY